MQNLGQVAAKQNEQNRLDRFKMAPILNIETTIVSNALLFLKTYQTKRKLVKNYSILKFSVIFIDL